MKVYQNDIEKDCEGLRTTKFWIGVSLFVKGSRVIMKEYKYD